MEVNMSRSVLTLGILFGCTFAIAQNKPTKSQKVQPQSIEASRSAAVLPVKRVVLYKNGVGYFEHTARVHGTQDLSIDFTSSQLNDVLKSLTAVDLGDGRISSVRYNSIAPLDERLKSLRLPFGEQVTRAGFLQAMRGARALRFTAARVLPWDDCSAWNPAVGKMRKATSLT